MLYLPVYWTPVIEGKMNTEEALNALLENKNSIDALKIEMTGNDSGFENLINHIKDNPVTVQSLTLTFEDEFDESFTETEAAEREEIITTRCNAIDELVSVLNNVSELRKFELKSAVSDYSLVPLLDHTTLANLEHLTITNEAIERDIDPKVINSKHFFNNFLPNYLEKNPNLTSLEFDDVHLNITASNYPKLKNAIIKHPNLVTFLSTKDGFGGGPSLSIDEDVTNALKEKVTQTPEARAEEKLTQLSNTIGTIKNHIKHRTIKSDFYNMSSALNILQAQWSKPDFPVEPERLARIQNRLNPYNRYADLIWKTAECLDMRSTLVSGDSFALERFNKKSSFELKAEMLKITPETDTKKLSDLLEAHEAITGPIYEKNILALDEKGNNGLMRAINDELDNDDFIGPVLSVIKKLKPHQQSQMFNQVNKDKKNILKLAKGDQVVLLVEAIISSPMELNAKYSLIKNSLNKKTIEKFNTSEIFDLSWQIDIAGILNNVNKELPKDNANVQSLNSAFRTFETSAKKKNDFNALKNSWESAIETAHKDGSLKGHPQMKDVLKTALLILSVVGIAYLAYKGVKNASQHRSAFFPSKKEEQVNRLEDLLHDKLDKEQPAEEPKGGKP